MEQAVQVTSWQKPLTTKGFDQKEATVQVTSWQKHAGSYLRAKTLVESSNAALSTANRQLRRRVAELAEPEEGADEGGRGGRKPRRELEEEVEALKEQLAAAKRRAETARTLAAHRCAPV